jgi:hypothetical protein
LETGPTVSEHQYYEFRAVDRPLSERDQRMLRALSTRAEITPTSFVNTYDWGDFKGDPDALMEKCFDAFVYTANWGTRRFVLRLPKKSLSRHVLSAYCVGGSSHRRAAGDFVVIEFNRQEDDGEWEEDEGWMASLIPLRADLLRGDHRSLYLGWLCCAQNNERDDDETEPPVPPGLKTLSGSLEALVEFLGIDSHLLDVAAGESAPLASPPTRAELAAWVRALPPENKDELLLDAALDAGLPLGAELLRRYSLSRKGAPSAGTPPARRTVGELLAGAEELAARKSRLAARARAAERTRQEREAAQARARYLDLLTGKEQAAWHNVEALIQTKQPNKYDIAVRLLVDLRDLATRQKQEAAFKVALEKLRHSHSAKPSLLRRILAAGL